MGTVRKRQDSYRAEVWKRGVRQSATFETRQEAVDWIVQRESDIIGGAVVQRSTHTVRDAITHYLGMRERGRSDVIRLTAISRLDWTAEPVATLRAETIAAWRDARAREVSPATVRREMTALRAVLEVARIELGWITSNPIRDVRRPSKPPARKRVISDAERDAVVQALGFDGGRVETIRHETAVALLLALETAMRAGELLALTPADVDYERRVAVLHTSKNGLGREVPLSTRAVALFRVMAGKQLINRRGADTGGVFYVSSGALDTTFRRARVAAGLAGFTFHDARATALTRLSKILQPLELARMSGHQNLSELLTYYRETASSIAERLG
jgi:integrase